LTAYPRVLPVGDAAASLELGDAIDVRLNARVRAADAALQERPFPGLREAAPAYRSLLVLFDPGRIGFGDVRDYIIVCNEASDAQYQGLEVRCMVYMLDVTVWKNPMMADIFRVPDADFLTQGGRFGPHQFNETRDNKLYRPQDNRNLLYVAYHVDHPIAVERINWYRNALPKFGRRIADYEICCPYHAHFLEREDDARLQEIVHKPMVEYGAAGVEAARKPPDPTAYKGYDQREAGQRAFTFNTYFPNRVLMGGPEQAIARIRQLKEAGITQVALVVDFGSMPQDEIMRSMEVFGRKVLPRIREI